MPEPSLIVALDVPNASQIAPLVDRIGDQVSWYKVGLELFVAEGPQALQSLRDKQVFLDLKLHDIPRTVANAVRAATAHGVGLLTLHASGGRDMMRAAAEARQEAGPHAPRLLAVTTLTSLNQDDLSSLGVTRPLPEHTLALAEMAVESGIDGLVCSVHEAPLLREKLGEKPLLVTPGIRLRPVPPAADGTTPGQVRPGNELADQKRVATPAMAVQAGADFLVVGRPIVQANDPAAAATQILTEMATGG